MTNEVWFPPGKIYFLKFQLSGFLLRYLDDLRIGDYPPEPDEYLTWDYGAGWFLVKKGGYEATRDRKHFSRLAKFIKPCDIAGELDARISLIDDPSPLIDYYVKGERNISPVREVEAGKQLTFISGYDRARCSYSDWRKSRRKLILC